MNATTGPDWAGGLAVLAAGVVIAAYVYGPTAVARLRAWWAAKRLHWVTEGIRVDAVTAGWVPERGESCPPLADPPVEDVVDELEETRPADLDECPRCDGTGMYVAQDEFTAGYVVCGWCAGTGVLAGPGRGWVA